MSEAFRSLRPSDIVPNLDEISQSIKAVQRAYEIGDADSINEVHLPEPWIPLGLGGDRFKLIAAEPNLRIVIKRYVYEKFADIVFRDYILMVPFIDENKAPFVMPIGQLGDALVFPYLDVDENVPSEWDTQISDLLRIHAEKMGVSLPVSRKFSKYKLADGTYKLGDIFDDSSNALLIVSK